MIAMALVWRDLSFSRNTSFLRNAVSKCYPLSDELIFNSLNGVLESQSMTALMGPSGAGKTTLLKCLSDGKQISGVCGQLYVVDSCDVRAVFITQSEREHLLMRLTVSESLLYASKLKNAFHYRSVDHKQNVNDLLRKLDLEKCEQTCVNKCSGGQCKRLAIALELTSKSKPNFLLLDEPTSGLDSYSGFKVINLLKTLSQMDKMSIIVTIHQPSYKILELFDLLYALSNSGNCIFAGRPTHLKAYLTRFGVDCPELHNPSDVLIEVASFDSRTNTKNQTLNTEITERKLRTFCTRLSNLFCCLKRNSYDQLIDGDHESDYSLSQPINNENMADYGTENYIIKSMKTAAKLEIEDKLKRTRIIGEIDDGLCVYKTKFSLQSIWMLLWRTVVNSIWREKRFILFRFALHAIIALILSVLYNHGMGEEDGCIPMAPSGHDYHNCSCADSSIKEEDMTSQNAKFHFFSLLFLMFAALMPTVLTFPDEVKVFLNEHRNGWYSTGSYYLSKTIAEIPIQLLFPFLYTWYLYYITKQIGMDDIRYGIPGLWRSRFTYFMLFTELTAFITQGMAFLIGILFVKSFNISIFVSSSLLLLLFLFSGFFVRVVQMGSASFLTYFSFVRFSFESLMIILYGLGRCDRHNRPVNATSLIRYESQSNFVSVIIYKFDLNEHDLWRKNFSLLILHLIVWRLLAYMALRCRVDSNFLRPKYLRKCFGVTGSLFNTIGPFIYCFGRKFANFVFWTIIVLGVILLIVAFILCIIGLFWLFLKN